MSIDMIDVLRRYRLEDQVQQLLDALGVHILSQDHQGDYQAYMGGISAKGPTPLTAAIEVAVKIRVAIVTLQEELDAREDKQRELDYLREELEGVSARLQSLLNEGA